MSNYQNNNQNAGPKKYLRANLGKIYIKTSDTGPYGFGDFCGLKIAAKFDQEGNISLQFDTDLAEDLKQVIGVFKDQTGLTEKYEAERAQYAAKKETQQASNGAAPTPRATYAPAAKPAYQAKKYSR